MSINCLSARTVKSYIRGESSDVDLETIESHVKTCKSCQRLLENLADEDDSDVPWLAAAKPETVQVGAQSVGSNSPHQTGEAITHTPSSSQKSEETKTMDTIRDYKIIEPIGQGGMGTVYLALHLRLNKLVALKILKSDRLESFEANSRFTREMRLLAQLEHPQIVRALDAGEFDGQQYFVMEFVPGIDLGQFIRRLGPIPVMEACEAIQQAAGALHYAHVHKILHRDIKPSNLMVTADGKIKLLDLGLAQLLDRGEASVTEADQAVGTFAYMAPETLYGSGTASAQSDVYSLGVTLFQMLTGMRPVERPGMPVLIPNLIAMRPDVLPELNAFVYRMIASDPAERPKSMQEVECLLKAFAGDADLPSLVAEYYRWGNRSDQQTHSRQLGLLSPPVQTSLPRPRRKAFWLRALAGVAATALVATLGYRVFPWIEPSPKPDATIVGTPDAETIVQSPSTELPKQATGTLKIVPHGDVASQLLDERRAYLVNMETNERITLDKNELQTHPLGKYRLHFDSPVALDGQDVEVLANTTNQLDIRATLTSYSFQFPTLPAVPGAYASYYGRFWREDWEKGRSTAFELSLEILPDANPHAMHRGRWIKLVANLPQDDYSETAYLKIDELLWEREHGIGIIEGFVQPKGRSITKFRESLPKDFTKDALIFPLNAETDHIEEIVGSALPERRISTQDFLTLFFGANNVTAAAEQVRTLRYNLAQPNKRNAWLEEINNGTGLVSCYVVSSRQKTDSLDSEGYSMARRDDELFGFVQLEVNLPSVVATCMLKSQTRQPGDTYTDLYMVDKCRREVVNPADLASSVQTILPSSPPQVAPQVALAPQMKLPWDLAQMPDEPMSVTYRGSIEKGDRKEVIEVQARMFWKGQDERRECRWLEFEVESTLDGRVHWEAARLLVDAEAYDATGEFKVLRGWVAFDEPGNVFEFPANADMDALVDARLQRQIDTRFDQVGIVDVLAMLFAAELKPTSTIGTLRGTVGGILRGAERKAVAEERFTKKGPVQGQLYRPPSGSPVQYEFFRSAVVPFGFVSVSLDVPFIINIGLEAQAYGPVDAASDSLFGSPQELSAAVIKNQEKIAANDSPNWRVWSWRHSGVDYKVWAEYAGEIEAGNTAADPRFVLLANSANKSIRVPYSDLSAVDRACVDEGRLWASGPKNVKQKLLEDNASTGMVKLTYKSPINNNRITGPSTRLATMLESDREWVLRRRSIERSPKKLEQAVKDWKDFVAFTRP